MDFGPKKFRETDLFDFTSFFGLDSFKFSGPLCIFKSKQLTNLFTFIEFVYNLQEYQEIKEEAPLEMPGQDPPPEWPQYGVVNFEKYQTRYREGLDLVLKGIGKRKSTVVQKV